MNGTMTTLGRVKAVIGDRIGVAADDIGDDTSLKELGSGLDSLDLVDIRIALELHFDLDTAAKIAAFLDGKPDLLNPPIADAATITIEITNDAGEVGKLTYHANGQPRRDLFDRAMQGLLEERDAV